MTDTTTQPRKPGRPRKNDPATMKDGETITASNDPAALAIGAENLKRLTEPAIEEHQDVHHTVAGAVRILIAALGYEEDDVKGVDIRANGIARVYGTNNSLRSVRFEGWK